MTILPHDHAPSHPAFAPAASAWRTSMAAQRPLLLIAGLVLALRFALLPNAIPIFATTIVQSTLAVLTGLVVVAPFALAVEMHRKGSMKAALEHHLPGLISRERLATAIPALIAIACVMNSFTHFKSSIPDFNGYDIDAQLAALDRVVHFGHDPWRLLEPILGYGIATKAVDIAYYAWFPIFFGTTAAMIVSPATSRLRNRYLTAFVLTWSVLGIAAAIAFASVGPIFYDLQYGGTSAFTPLIEGLRQVDARFGLNTLMVQERLWQSHIGADVTAISGISAMPSLHNAVCALLVLLTWRIHRVLAAMALVFAAIIFVGSVHLGWHYAIDAYASWIAVAVIWKVAGRLAGDTRKRGAGSREVPGDVLTPARP